MPFRLNYDKETPLAKIDLAGEDQVVRMAEFVTKQIDNLSHGLTVQKAMEKLGLRNKRDLIPGMEVRLLPHQIIGVSWMVDQEKVSQYKGGILADDMGLGKTVQMIATMAINQPTGEDKARTTLIIVPAALLLQWKEELESKTNGIFDVHIQHGRDKLKSPEAFKKYDVIITTYHTLNQDFAIPSNVDPEDELEWVWNKGGPMARAKWYRVIADEAQFIRNRATRSSKAAAMLRAKYRWCLTGTPVTNTLADIYGLLRFGHFRPWNHWPDFNEYIAKMQLEDAPLAGLRAQEVLKPLMMRRTKDSELEGEPILQLPPKDIELVRVEFSPEEREVYDAFEKSAQLKINKFIKEKSLVKNASFILVLILRLRQLCCHPYLILNQTDAYEDPTLLMSGEAEKELARARKVMGSEWVNRIKKGFLERAKRTKFNYDDEVDPDDDDGTCPNCGDVYADGSGRVLSCGHVLCFDCLLELRAAPPAHNGIFGEGDEQSNLQVEKDFEAAVSKGLRPCPVCKKMTDLTESRVFKSIAFEPTEDEFRDATRRTKPAAKPLRQTKLASISKAKKEDKPEFEFKGFGEIIDLDSSDDDLPDPKSIFQTQAPKSPKVKVKKNTVHKQSMASQRKNTYRSGKNTGLDEALLSPWRKGDNDMEPSAKMLALIKFLKEWEASGDKTIAYSQWTSMLDLVETLFARYGIQCLRYDGRMNREAREVTLARFRKSGGPKVILISTRCGGVGLNLVSANRVVNMDLCWNYATESQAYDRVHRLGQEKDVFVKRLVVEDTIEDRMLKLQDTKTGLAEAALGEGGAIRLHKLSVKELKSLFGMDNMDNNNSSNSSQGS
ncbi:hypothetical protein K474DRAFT_1737680 [Panus rudis PR-1116 ss-1]|nr:hypothetical protein K474DRAFT_1737680 [Panus rudis PR-1116 ss-1]